MSHDELLVATVQLYNYCYSIGERPRLWLFGAQYVGLLELITYNGIPGNFHADLPGAVGHVFGTSAYLIPPDQDSSIVVAAQCRDRQIFIDNRQRLSVMYTN